MAINGNNKKQKSFEQTLWDTADKLRGTVESSEYKHVVLSLIFFKDQHEDLKADYIMANPPFNLKEWRNNDELTDDPRWSGYEVPPTGNANYGWILHMISKLSESGVAGFCKAATLEEIRANDYVLTPGRYVGAAEIEDDGVVFEQKMADLTQILYRQMQESEKLDVVIRQNLEVLGYKA